jgi:hypothetical protein
MTALHTADWEPATPRDAIPDLVVDAGERAVAGPPPAPEPPRDGLDKVKKAPEGGPNAVKKGPSDEKPQEDTLEVIIPSAEPRAQTILSTDGKVVTTYTQKPLSYLRKMQFFRLVARTLKGAIDESGAAAVADLFSGGTAGVAGALASSDVDDAGSFMHLIASVVELAEDFLEEAYVIWLAVPPGQREWAKAAMRGDLDQIEPLSDEDGKAILTTFVVQNWAAMQRFFRQDLREVFEVARSEQRRLNQQEG